MFFWREVGASDIDLEFALDPFTAKSGREARGGTMDANQICKQAHDDFLRHLSNNDHKGVSDVGTTCEILILISHAMVK